MAARERIFGAGRGKKVRQHLAASERGERQRANELFSGAGHDHLDGEAPLHERARQLRRLIGRDASADTERDVHGTLVRAYSFASCNATAAW